VLPGLADHFTLRFGEAPWAIIDERRGLALVRRVGEAARIIPREEAPQSAAVPGTHKDPWEDLWRNYHRVVANESRVNPRLQQQFMPQRYWKYLPELREEH
jgi:probable DNA metabolism protein